MKSINQPGSTLHGIEFFRGIAALLVVIYHISRHLNQNNGYFPFGRITEFGHAGVDFFFVLSGFIILFVHFDDLGNRKSLWSYCQKRFTRIYPFYWIVCLLTLAMVPFVPSASVPEWQSAIKSLLLVPQSDDLLIGVAWTLQHEVLFYLLFALAIVSIPLALIVMSIWFLVIISANYFIHFENLPPVIFNPFNIEFLMGMAAAYVVKKDVLAHPRLTFLLGVGLFAGTAAMELTGLLDGFGSYARIGYGLGGMLIIIGASVHERRHGLHIPWLGRILGRSSYSIYLTHLIFNGLAYKLITLTGFQTIAPSWIIAVVLILFSVAGACFFSHLVEIPITNWVRRQIRPMRQSASATVS